MSFFRWSDNNTLILQCHLQPRASRDEFAGVHGDSLKIRITAPPADGKANAHLINFISIRFGVAKRNVKIINGELSREKTLAITGPKNLPAELAITPAA
ncbi:MAG: YggU family protein [Oceanospirillaceae bacterium]|nr:YggU family protein [Oceanospirillaceae bacterium]MCP5350529.1 YggU family protein [Oceanospirillaceae bacterium]